MNRSRANDICAAFAGAELEFPFGPETATWKVGGKIFALINPEGEGLSVKCQDPETAAFLIDIGVARPAPYLKRGGWVQIPWRTLEDGVLDEDDLAHRLQISYQTVCARLPKRLRPVP